MKKLSVNVIKKGDEYMNSEQAVLEKLRQLPVDKQQELLNFAEFLDQKNTPKTPLRSVRGLCTDLAVDITD